MNAQTLYQNLFERAKNAKILVIGDTMLDIYTYGGSHRLCREAPVPIVDVSHSERMPGGAANTVLNIVELGGQAAFLSLTGDDEAADIVLSYLEAHHVNVAEVQRLSQRSTLTKHRVLSDNQLLVRLDEGTSSPADEQSAKNFNKALSRLYNWADAILVSDYSYGTISEATISKLSTLHKNNPKLLLVDAKYPQRFASVMPDVVKPSYKEAAELLQIEKLQGEARLQQIHELRDSLLEATKAACVIVTFDVDGALVLRPDEIFHVKAPRVQHPMAAGAGDTFVSALTLALCAEASVRQAVEIAARAGSIAVSKEGTATCSAEEIIAAFTEPPAILKNLAALERCVNYYRHQEKRIVFTNGCFDILHRGHIQYLEQAKALGDVLIIGVNSDDSVHELKGPERPINRLEDRLSVLKSIGCVDHTIGFDEATPISLIQTIKPDVYVKGGDYIKDNLPEAAIVESLGGVVRILPYYANWSTTSVIKKVQRRKNRIGN
jgi:D-beta-D-heptose 7-phosphate kinase / D-beta-D-heptose 1-phosphate adenosyltransferase